MNVVEVGTDLYVPVTEAYAFVRDFERYAESSKYLESVEVDGDGDPGTTYELTFAWWKLSHTFHSTVTATDPPKRLDWALTGTIDAHGSWIVEPLEHPDHDDACTVRLRVEYNPESATDAIDVPALVSLDWVIDKITPLIENEAKRVVARIVADLEGDPRPIELTLRHS